MVQYIEVEDGCISSLLFDMAGVFFPHFNELIINLICLQYKLPFPFSLCLMNENS